MTDVRFDKNGLVAAIVQDAGTGRVLMLGWMNHEALELTRSTGNVHFWSRSRQELWKKGETSGNLLAVVSIAVDCDGDAVLVQATPSGPTCHTGRVSCFDDDATTPHQGFDILESLWRVVADRAAARPVGSYTVELLDGGVDAVARKVGEEATEVVLAAKDHAVGAASDDRLAEEIADLLYHLLALLTERGLEASRVNNELRARMS